jgi:hypothetical protein
LIPGLRAAKVSVSGGEMAEWLKAHAWKACILQKGIEGSNPSLSASLIFQILATPDFLKPASGAVALILNH